MTFLERKWAAETEHKMAEAKAHRGDVPICRTCFNPYRRGPMGLSANALICDICGMAFGAFNGDFAVRVTVIDSSPDEA